MTATQPPHSQPESAQSTVLPQRFDRVGRAARVVPAHRREGRRDESLIEADRCDEEPGRGGHGAFRRPTGGRRAGFRLARCCRSTHSAPHLRKPEFRSARRSALVASAAAGNARTTTSLPVGSTANSGRSSARSRRLTRCLITALPTLEETTRPARAGRGWSVRSTWTARRRADPRRPVPRTAANSVGRVSRRAAGSTTVRPTAPGGPSSAGRPGWLVRRGCASGAGSRESWPDGGCSAEKYACSRHCLHNGHSGAVTSGEPPRATDGARSQPPKCGRLNGQHERPGRAGLHRTRVRTAPEPGQGGRIRLAIKGLSSPSTAVR
jgi:hypothetical protein